MSSEKRLWTISFDTPTKTMKCESGDTLKSIHNRIIAFMASCVAYLAGSFGCWIVHDIIIAIMLIFFQ